MSYELTEIVAAFAVGIAWGGFVFWQVANYVRSKRDNE